MNTPPFIVTDGGPHGFKTTFLAKAQERLGDYGKQLYIIPEAARELFGGGVTVGEIGIDPLTLQDQILLRTLENENRFRNIALASANAKNIVLMGDRGTLTGIGYIGRDAFMQRLDILGLDPAVIGEKTYKAVIYLRSCAYDAPHLYKTDNERRESVEEARILDERTLEAWIGHPHLRVIDNSGGFETKFNRYIQEICEALGMPVPIEHERKFLVKKVNLDNIGTYRAAEIEQSYLLNKTGRVERIRRRRQFTNWIHYHTIKTPAPGSGSYEVESIVSEAEAVELLWRRDTSLYTIKKDRICFVYKNQYFELDRFRSHPSDEYDLLEFESTVESGKDMVIPPYIQIVKEVTGEWGYSNYAIAQRKTLVP